MNALRKFRYQAHITQKSLSERSGVSYQMIRQYESEVRSLRKAQAETVLRLARSLGCTVEDLLTDVV